MRYTTLNEEYLQMEYRIGKLSQVGSVVRYYVEEVLDWKPIRNDDIPKMLKHLDLDERMELVKFYFNSDEFKEAVYLSWTIRATYTTSDPASNVEIGLTGEQKKVISISLERVFDYFNTKAES